MQDLKESNDKIIHRSNESDRRFGRVIGAVLLIPASGIALGLLASNYFPQISRFLEQFLNSPK